MDTAFPKHRLSVAAGVWRDKLSLVQRCIFPPNKLVGSHIAAIDARTADKIGILAGT